MLLAYGDGYVPYQPFDKDWTDDSCFGADIQESIGDTIRDSSPWQKLFSSYSLLLARKLRVVVRGSS